MVHYNPSIIANLKPRDFIDQIDALKARKEEILAFFDAGRLASKPKMRAIIEARFKDLDRIRGYYEVELRRTTRQVKPRTLKSQADMYREFTEDEVNDFWQNQDGGAYYRKLQRHGGDTGWELLSTICAARGFDARPDVVDDAAFWAKAASAKYHMFRGVDPRGSDKTTLPTTSNTTTPVITELLVSTAREFISTSTTQVTPTALLRDTKRLRRTTTHSDTLVVAPLLRRVSRTTPRS